MQKKITFIIRHSNRRIDQVNFIEYNVIDIISMK